MQKFYVPPLPSTQARTLMSVPRRIRLGKLLRALHIGTEWHIRTCQYITGSGVVDRLGPVFGGMWGHTPYSFANALYCGSASTISLWLPNEVANISSGTIFVVMLQPY